MTSADTCFGETPLYLNELYRLTEENELRRIIYVAPEADALVTIQVDASVNVPQWDQISKWRRLAIEGKLEPVADDRFLRFPLESSLTDATRARRDKAWEAITPMITDTPHVFSSDRRAAMIKAVAQNKGVHADTVRNWLFCYWQRGISKNALLPDWDKCGVKGQRKPDTAVKRGRPRTVSPGEGINCTSELQGIFEVMLKAHYLRSKSATVRGAWKQMLRKYFGKWIIEERADGELVLDEVGTYPSLGQFRYWRERGRDIAREARARKGKNHYERTLRALLGNSTADAFGPGYRYQIDATVADVYLVSKVDRRVIIGRPVWYVVIDVWSRMIVGIYVGMENASWNAAMMALLNAASDKVAFCAKFGIEITRDEWPAYGLSSVVLADQGEFRSKLAENMPGVLSVDVENTPSYRPDWKGCVESSFRLLPAKFKEFVPGYVEFDYEERGGTDYRHDALLSLDEFTKIVIISVLEHNEMPIRGYPLTPRMIKDGVLETPNELWEWGIKNRGGLLRAYPEETLRFGLMHVTEASVTESGIRLFDRFYDSAHATEHGWSTKARAAKVFKVSVSYDPRNLDEILLHIPGEQRRFDVCCLRSSDPDELGLSLQELEAKKGKAKQNVVQHVHAALQAELNRDVQKEKVVEEARRKKSAGGPDERSKTARTKDIRKNRTAEHRQNLKDEEKFRHSTNPIEESVLDGDRADVPKSPSTAKSFGFPSVFEIMKGRGS